MTEKEKKKILQGLTTRISTGVDFLYFNYLIEHSTPDPAWIRNIYILFSFYTELLLKAIFVAVHEFKDIDSLDARLRAFGHNLETACRAIPSKQLRSFGLKSVRYEKKEYLVETEWGSFWVKDFTDIRYDFLDGRVRTLTGEEHKMFEEQREAILKILEKLKPIAWGWSDSR